MKLFVRAIDALSARLNLPIWAGILAWPAVTAATLAAGGDWPTALIGGWIIGEALYLALSIAGLEAEIELDAFDCATTHEPWQFLATGPRLSAYRERLVRRVRWLAPRACPTRADTLASPGHPLNADGLRAAQVGPLDAPQPSPETTAQPPSSL